MRRSVFAAVVLVSFVVAFEMGTRYGDAQQFQVHFGKTDHDQALAAYRALQPNEFFRGKYLNITVPNSTGWFLVKSSPAEWSIAQKGPGADESYGALVKLFPLPESATADDLLALIKKEIAQTSARFTDVQSTVKPSEERKYPCVRYRGTTDDTKAKVAADRTTSLILEMEGLYCRHPTLPMHDGLAIIFSHRGHATDPQFQSEADTFIAGVQVPGY